MKLIIISNRLPLTVVKNDNGYATIRGAGGLSTGLDSLETNLEKHWIGWPGISLTDPKEKKKVDTILSPQFIHPVHLSHEQIELYYEGYSNSVLWPLFHYFFSYVRYRPNYWEAYKEVNALFCEKALEVIEPDDIVWVQDYHLMLLPQLIRARCPQANIGFFLHIPFPSYEMFRCLPERAQLLRGLLGADLVGFHTHDYMRYFISAVFHVLKIDYGFDRINLDGRMVDVGAFPMGINFEMFHNAILDAGVSQKAKVFREELGNEKLMLSVDRLDYSKGILIRLKTFANFLQNNPEYHGKVSIVMIVAPSRDHVDIYAKLKRDIDKMVGNINGKFSKVGWVPVYYHYRSFNFEELAALYHISEICMVNSFRDGMNLVAKEYIATKRDEEGVLILSELAGSSNQLTDALIINPTDMKDMENAILRALKMPADQQRKRINKMQRNISFHHVGQWAKDFIEELGNINKKNKELQEKQMRREDVDKIKSAYMQANRRLLILDYDGTLSSFCGDPMDATPTADTISMLEELCKDSANRVVISSGRDKETLEQWLGHLPLDMAAEHGMFYKERGAWHRHAKKMEWSDEIMDVMKLVLRKTPSSKLEIKETTLTWHYREVDVELAELRVIQLINALITPCSRQGLQIMKGHKNIEIKSKNYNKGTEALRLVKQQNYDFVMAIGDDTTDEEMFMALPKECFTIKVGANSDVARYNIAQQEQVVPFLRKLIKAK